MITLEKIVEDIRPEKTVLLFGAGSSIPSGAPSVATLISTLETRFAIDAGLDLREISTVVETRQDRTQLVEALRPLFKNLAPTGGVLTVPRFDWKAIYTTNYDQLIEQSFNRLHKTLNVYSSNFDFRRQNDPQATPLYKLHGTVEKDVSDGHRSPWIISDQDYDLTEDYREYLYQALSHDLVDADLLIIGHSMADPDIKETVFKAIELRKKVFNSGGIYLLMYSGTADKALIYENRNIQVAVGGIDEFFAALTTRGLETKVIHAETGDPLDVAPELQPVTIDVKHRKSAHAAKVADMFNGWPATYSEITAGLTFARSVVDTAKAQIASTSKKSVLLLGASGVGKTTAARQLLLKLNDEGHFCWEHQSDNGLSAEAWLKVASKLKHLNQRGFLFIDQGDEHLYELNDLFDAMADRGLENLHVVIAASRNHWNPRIKTPTLLNASHQYVLEKLDAREITELLRLVAVPAISELVGETFLAFSASERRLRIEERFEKDMFVCLRNIFASESFDDIILREYASLSPEYRDIYKFVAALESVGVRVHRQLIIRLLNVPMNNIDSILTNLTDIVHEYAIDKRYGIYGWRGRHAVIMAIAAKYKFGDAAEYVKLFERVIDALMPTLDIELRTLISLCSADGGINRIPDRRIQNRLLAKMISVAPGERIPRHRLIRNLIDIDDFEGADAEIRVFKKDFREDGPVHRYRVLLLMARARNAAGILEEDRVAILKQASELALAGVRKFKDNKHLMYTYCEVGIDLYKRTGDLSVFEEALTETRRAERRLSDPEITRKIDDYEKRIIRQTNMSLSAEAEDF